MSVSLFSPFLAFISPYINHAKGQTNKSLQMVVPAAATMSSTIASFMFAGAIICQSGPYEARSLIEKLKQRLKDYLNPCIKTSFREFAEERPSRSMAFTLVEAYLSSISSKCAGRLRAGMEKDGGNLVLSMDDHQQVADEFEGVKVWWGLRRVLVSSKNSILYAKQGKRAYKLTFPKEYTEIVTKSYLEHVMKKGKEISINNRQRKLCTNVDGC